MNEPRECIEITERFFKVIDELKAMKRLRGLKTFARIYNLNQSNLQTAKTTNKRIKQEWLSYLVRDFDVSPKYLLTGMGKMFNS